MEKGKKSEEPKMKNSEEPKTKKSEKPKLKKSEEPEASTKRCSKCKVTFEMPDDQFARHVKACRREAREKEEEEEERLLAR